MDLGLSAGEIHALIGENGAGKSTLIKIAGGVFAPDAGTILLDDKPVRFADPRDAQRQGIIVIHQTPTLCPHLSVTENILLGHLPTRWGIVQWKRANELAANLLVQLGVVLPLDAPVGTLSAAQQQLVALARALSLRARWLILDEPTAALSRSETERLFAILRQLKPFARLRLDDGKSRRIKQCRQTRHYPTRYEHADEPTADGNTCHPRCHRVATHRVKVTPPSRVRHRQTQHQQDEERNPDGIGNTRY